MRFANSQVPKHDFQVDLEAEATEDGEERGGREVVVVQGACWLGWIWWWLLDGWHWMPPNISLETHGTHGACGWWLVFRSSVLNLNLGGGFVHIFVIFTPKIGEMIPQFDVRIFFRWACSTTT